MMQSKGYLVNEHAHDILEAFGSLTIKPVYRNDDIFRCESITYDPLLALLTIDNNYQYWQVYKNMELTLIGDMSKRAVLMVDKLGHVYIQALRNLQFCGTDIIDAMDNVLVFGRRNTTIIHER